MMEHSTIKIVTLLICCLLVAGLDKPVSAQSLDELLSKESKPETKYATATFKTTRIINGHSIERMEKNQLEFRISHRFGEVSRGSYDLYGLDLSTIHFSLEYGVTNWLEIGAGRSSFEKTADGFAKFTILRQSTGAREMPVHLSYVVSMEVNGLKWSDPTVTNYFGSRVSYVHQLLIARKFNKSFSLEVNPTFVHRNLVKEAIEPNDLYAMGVGARYKITARTSLNAEYYYVYRRNAKYLDTKYYNPLSVGIDIETGGHVFQIMFTNCQSMREAGFIGKTTGNWLDRDFRLGFNISRTFSL
jgi:hypothetical protein